MFRLYSDGDLTRAFKCESRHIASSIVTNASFDNTFLGAVTFEEDTQLPSHSRASPTTSRLHRRPVYCIHPVDTSDASAPRSCGSKQLNAEAPTSTSLLCFQPRESQPHRCSSPCSSYASQRCGWMPSSREGLRRAYPMCIHHCS